MNKRAIVLLAAIAMPIAWGGVAAQTPLNPFSLRAGSAPGTLAAGDDPRITGALAASGGDASATKVLPPGASIARTQAARAGDVFNVLDYGADPTGVGDIGVVLNAIAAKLSPTSANVIDIPPGHYTLATAVTFNNVAPVIRGHGFTAGPSASGSSGTWITISPATPAGFVAFTVTGTNARGTIVRDIAFTETQPAPAPGWAPAGYGPVFDIVNTLGEVTFENVLFSGVDRGIYADNSGRLNIRDMRGQFFTSAVEIDDCYDIPRIERLHAWPYSTSSPYVIAWQEANENTVLLRRVDGIFIDNLFSLGAYAALRLSSGANGVTTKAYVNDLYADFVDYGVLIDGAGTDAQIANMTTQGNDQTAPANTLPGSNGIWVNTTSATLQLGNVYTKLTAGPAIEVDGSGNRLGIANFRANTYGTPGAGTEAIHVSDTGANPTNSVYVGNKEQLQGTSPLVLFNTTSNGGRERFMMMNDVGGANVNEPRAYAGSAGGGPVSLSAIGGDASVDLQLQAKSVTGSVKLQSNGQTVLRTDDANSGVDDGLLRSGAATLNWIAEGAEASIDWYWVAKGVAGGIRMQANGLVTLRTDNPNAGDSDLLMRPGTGSANLIVESASASADIVLAGKGSAGGIRLQANGNTSLRTDNPNAVADDLLVRPGSGTMALTAEGADANVNLVLTPKGAGTVVVTTLGCTDNSTNAASTAFVKACAAGSGSGVTSFAGRTGSVTLLSADISTALGFTAYSSANPSGFIAASGAPVQSVAGRTGAIALAVADVSGAARTASPALTGATTVSLASGGTLKVVGAQPGGSGFAREGHYLLVGTSSSTSSLRLTTDGNTAGVSNCINLAAGSTLSAYIDFTGRDTNSVISARYRALDVLVDTRAAASTTQMANAVSAVSANGNLGTVTGLSFSIGADTTNGCLAVSVVPPNADTWHWAARVLSTEVQ